MDEGGVIKMIRVEIERAGSLRALAREWSITSPYLCNVVNGKQPPGPKILGPLGLKKSRVIAYAYSPTR